MGLALTIAQSRVNGILLGGIYGLLVSGLSLIFGVMRVINFAHGEFLMFGALATYWLAAVAGLPPLLAMAATVPLAFLAGRWIHSLLIRRTRAAP